MNEDIKCPNCKSLSMPLTAKLAGKDRYHKRVFFCDCCGLWIIVGLDGTIIDYSFIKPSLVGNIKEVYEI